MGPSDLQRQSLGLRKQCMKDYINDIFSSSLSTMETLACIHTVLVSSAFANGAHGPVRKCTGRVRAYRISIRIQITKHVLWKPRNGETQSPSLIQQQPPLCHFIHNDNLFSTEKL